jgi:hypothetical protein
MAWVQCRSIIAFFDVFTPSHKMSNPMHLSGAQWFLVLTFVIAQRGECKSFGQSEKIAEKEPKIFPECGKFLQPSLSHGLSCNEGLGSHGAEWKALFGSAER